MKCPHCEYKESWFNDDNKYMKGDKGGFYRLPVKIERKEGWEDEQETLHACPKCGKTFIEISSY